MFYRDQQLIAKNNLNATPILSWPTRSPHEWEQLVLTSCRNHFWCWLHVVGSKNAQQLSAKPFVSQSDLAATSSNGWLGMGWGPSKTNQIITEIKTVWPVNIYTMFFDVWNMCLVPRMSGRAMFTADFILIWLETAALGKHTNGGFKLTFTHKIITNHAAQKSAWIVGNGGLIQLVG